MNICYMYIYTKIYRYVYMDRATTVYPLLVCLHYHCVACTSGDSNCWTCPSVSVWISFKPLGQAQTLRMSAWRVRAWRNDTHTAHTGLQRTVHAQRRTDTWRPSSQFKRPGKRVLDPVVFVTVFSAVSLPARPSCSPPSFERSSLANRNKHWK